MNKTSEKEKTYKFTSMKIFSVYMNILTSWGLYKRHLISLYGIPGKQVNKYYSNITAGETQSQIS